MIRLLPLLLGLLACSLHAEVTAPAKYVYKVTAERMSDADTGKFIVSEGPNKGTRLTVRLAGIDAPETPKGKGDRLPGQPLGPEAHRFAVTFVTGKTLWVYVYDIDQYRRLVSEVTIETNGTMRSLNVELVRQGYAEVYREYLRKLPKDFVEDLNKAENDARKNRRGIWNLPNYERPGDYRKRTKAS